MRLRLLVLAAAALLIGCGDGERSASTEFPGGVAEGATRSASLPTMRGALEVPHRGTRKVEVFAEAEDGSATYLAYREAVAVDASGALSLEPLGLLTEAAVDPITFELEQRSRARFLMRYRDFAVRDEALFLQNYAVKDLGPAEPIDGRATSGLSIERRDGRRSFTLRVDDATGLVLVAEERGADGRLESRVSYETVSFAPAFTDVVFHRSAIREEGLAAELATDEARIQLHRPRLLPAGYELQEVTLLTEEDGKRWAKLTYTDGVDPLFLLQAQPALGEAPASGAVHHPEGDRVLVNARGSVLTLQARIADFEWTLVGKLAEREALDLIESALP